MSRIPRRLIRHKPSTEVIRYAACSHEESRRGENNHTANGRAGKSQVKAAAERIDGRALARVSLAVDSKTRRYSRVLSAIRRCWYL